MNTSQYWFSTAGGGDLGDEITNSLRFHNSTTVLHRTQVATTINDDKNFTFATWFKLGFIGEQNIFVFANQNPENWILRWTTANNTFGTRHVTGGIANWDTTPDHTDNVGWYHLLVQCTNGALDLYVNGAKVGSQIAASLHSSGFDRPFVIGAENTNGGSSMQGYLADTYFIQGAQLHPINDGFVRINDDGVLVPDTPTISSYGDNGFHLDYADASNPGNDVSGENHHFTAVGFDTASISASNESNDTGHVDTPTLLYPQYNRVAMSSSQTTSQANLQTSASSYTWAPATIAIPADCGKKFYWEVTIRNNAGNETLGMVDPTQRVGQAPAHGWVFCPPLNNIESDQGNISTVVDTGATSINTGNGTTYMFAYDADTQNVWIGEGGNWYRRNGASGNGDPANNSNPFLTTSDGCIVDGELYAPATAGSSAGTTEYEINFGQMDFVHTVPSGFVHLNSTNLPEPTIKKGNKHFGVLTYAAPASPSFPITINGSGGNNGTGDLDFDTTPDLVWIKMRNGSQNNILFDSVRGASVSLRSDGTNSESARTNFAFATNGFTFSAQDAESYQQNDNYVAWCWKAGGTAVSNTNGTITSSVSANTQAGFSVVSYTGNQTNNATVGHGLSETPECIILKDRDTAVNWIVYHKGVDSTNPEQFFLHLNSTDTRQDLGDVFNDVAPGSSVFTLGNSTQSNGNTKKYIAYCWHSVEGYSKFGSYTGNGSADGSFVYLGFKPAFILLKSPTGAFDWQLYDSTRSPNNPATLSLRPNLGNAEVTSGNDLDILANGFKCRDNGSPNNNSGSTYIYMAFAENPFGGENVPPATAR